MRFPWTRSIPEPAPAPAPEQWGAFAYTIVCPDSHTMGLDVKFCPECGRPVPGYVAEQARQATQLLDAKSGLHGLRPGL